MKFARMLILALGLAILATVPSYAITQWGTVSAPTLINADAQTGLIGTILFQPLAPGNITAGEVITYQLPTNIPISYLTDISVAITGTNASAFADNFGSAAYAPAGTTWTTYNSGTNWGNSYGLSATATTAGNHSNITVTVNQYTITIAFNAPNLTFATTDFIQINGVRVDPVAVSTGANANIAVSLSSATGQSLVTTGTLNAATFVQETGLMRLTSQGMSSTGVVGTAYGMTFYANGTPYAASTGNTNSQSMVTLTLAELFPNAFETKTTNLYSGYNQYTRIKIDIAIPSGVPLTITGVNLAGVNGATFVNGHNTYYDTLTAITANPLQISITGQSASVAESLQVGLTFAATTAGVLPTSATSIGITAQLDAHPNPTMPFNYYYMNFFPQILRYRAMTTPYAATIPVSFVPLTSNLFSPFNFAARDASGSSFIYDTGFAVSNLSGSNPTTLSSYPASSPGIITVFLYPMDGTGPFSIATNSTSLPAAAKTGLDSNGQLASKATWKVLLSQLLVPAGISATAESFTGFVRFKCNFTEAAGISYVSDSDFNRWAVGLVMQSDTPTQINTSNQFVPPIF